MKAKFILYISGGTMTGVFGAGVVSSLQDLDLYDRIEAIYSASAGTITAAYFTARQSRLGSSIFYEDLTHNFVSITKFYKGIWDRIKAGLQESKSHDHFRDALNIDYLFRVITQKKVLDIRAVVNQPIPIYTKLLNLKTKQIEYFDIRKGDTLALLRASVLLVPYVHEVYESMDNKYTDAALIEPLGLKYIANTYPNRKIVVIFNLPLERKLRYKFKNLIEGQIMSYMYDKTFYPLLAQVEDKLRDELTAIRENPKMVLLHPGSDSPTRSRTTDFKKLRATYQQGVDAGKSLVL